MKITSLKHPLIAHWRELRLTREYREEKGRCLVVGEKMARELPIEVLITTEPSDIKAKEKYLVSEEILKKITGLQQPDGFAAEVLLPQPIKMGDQQFILVLDQIADPGNLGTLCRTALALGWEAVVVTPGTVDLFNDKALRAGKGAQFRLPYAKMEKPDELKAHFYTADLEGQELGSTPFKPPLALILSSEGHGPSNWAKKCKKITIPMKGPVESLNVATSGAILLYTMGPK